MSIDPAGNVAVVAALLPPPTAAAATRYSNVDRDTLIGSAVDMHRRLINMIIFCGSLVLTVFDSSWRD